MDVVSRAHESIQCAFEARALHIYSNRRRKRKSLSVAMFLAIAERLKESDQSEEIQCVPISGPGVLFCEVHDLAAFDEWPRQQDHPVPTFLHAIAELRKPVVIAMLGSATGVAVTWLLIADWIVTSANAVFPLPPLIDLAIVLVAASTLLLQKAVGLPPSKRSLLCGESFAGASAHDWTPVSELSPPEQFTAPTWSRSTMLASKDAEAIRYIKGCLWPAGAYHGRIGDEVTKINAAIGRSRDVTESQQ